ncbi:MAG: hypothetical protein ACTSQP_04130 [Promethearchaeota archaeon]
MLNVEDFSDNYTLQNLIIKFNKFIDKGKTNKINKILEQFEDLLEDEDSVVPVSYIFSILAENRIDLISEDLIKKLEPYLDSDNLKLKINTIIIFGFYILKYPEKIRKYAPKFFKYLLYEKNGDIRDNVYFFIQEFVEINPKLINLFKKMILKTLKIENNPENLLILLNLIRKIKTLDFKQLYFFRENIKNLLDHYNYESNPELFKLLIDLIKKFFPALEDIDLLEKDVEEIKNLLDNQFIMKKYNFTELAKAKRVNIKNLIEKFKQTRLKNKEIYFYFKNKKNNSIYFYELEKDKLLKVFENIDKISRQKLQTIFDSIIDNEFELEQFIKTLVKLNHIKGYFSNFYFYSFNSLKNEIENKLKEKGVVNLKNYEKFLPSDYVQKIIDEIISETKDELLLSKTGKTYYSLKSIQSQINESATKCNSIDLKAYRDRLRDSDFIKLVKSLPKEYLTTFHKGTNWLTNIGKNKIIKEIENSKILGYLDLRKISEKLNIRKILLIEILGTLIDPISGIWDKNKEVFYYSKFLKEKIDEIYTISDKEEKEKQIKKLARELNIPENLIVSKIDENYRLIGEEIKTKDSINISEYLEKTGMDYDTFMNFIGSLGLEYLIKGDQLIFSQEKIEHAKNEIKKLLVEKAKNEAIIELGNFGIKSELVENLIKELEKEDKIKGIFYEDQGQLYFYTKKGIKELMIENSMLFCFEDFFYGKELSENEKELMKEVLFELIKSKRLKGQFDEEKLLFSSDEMIFTGDYASVVDDFKKTVNNYIRIFDREFQTIKNILIKRNEVIYPQEIKMIQDIFDRINVNYVKWRAEINRLVNKATNELLKKQGYTLKRYEGLPADKKAEIRVFKEEPEVYDTIQKFETWVKFFNELESTYGKIIFLQKNLINNPEDIEIERKLEELLEHLGLM